MSQMDRETEWNAQRIGKISASHTHELMAQGKGGSPSVTRDKYMIRLIKERLTGVIEENFQSKAMTWGIETEDEARNAYFGETLNLVQEVLFIDWFGQDMVGCSPDGLVGDDGLIEIKCRESHNHIKYLLDEGKIDGNAMKQTQSQMLFTGRQWCDYVHYDNRFPNGLDLHIYRIEKDQKVQDEICAAIVQFQYELNEKMALLKTRLT